MEIIGHRGARAYAPENTILGCQVALNQGVDVIDVDVVATSDKVFIAYHDLIINPDILCDSKGNFLAASAAEFYAHNEFDSSSSYLIKNQKFSHLKSQYQVSLNPKSSYAAWFNKQDTSNRGEVSSLQEIIDYVNLKSQNNINFQFEIKNSFKNPDFTYSYFELANLMYAFIVKNQLQQRVKIQAFDWRILYRLNQLDKTIKTAYLVDEDTLYNWQHNFIDSEIIDSAKQLIATQYSALYDLSNNIITLVGKNGQPNKPNHKSELNKNNADNLTDQEQAWAISRFLINLIKNLGGYSYEPEDNELTFANLCHAHQCQLKVYVWGWPEHSKYSFNPALMKKLINWGVDGIITDDPVLLKNLYCNNKYSK